MSIFSKERGNSGNYPCLVLFRASFCAVYTPEETSCPELGYMPISTLGRVYNSGFCSNNAYSFRKQITRGVSWGCSWRSQPTRSVGRTCESVVSFANTEPVHSALLLLLFGILLDLCHYLNRISFLSQMYLLRLSTYLKWSSKYLGLCPQRTTFCHDTCFLYFLNTPINVKPHSVGLMW